MRIPNANYLQAKLIADVLAAYQIERVVISPGSRSTPLARTFYLDDRFFTTILTDERSAGFFALGQAKASGKAVALVCTSGTAAGHYYPAIIEAAQTGIPLVVLTADRPKHLRHKGTPQTIDQAALFGKYSRMMVDLDSPVASTEAQKEMLYWVMQCVRCALEFPQGPVQINVTMDEPLAPVDLESETCTQIASGLNSDVAVTLASRSIEVSPEELNRFGAAFCGLIVCGYDSARDEAEQSAIYGLARQLGWPILADVTSGLRFSGEPVMPFHDLFLRAEEYSKLAPDCVIEFGCYPTGKTLSEYLNRHRAWTLRVQRDTTARDPDSRASNTVIGDVAQWSRTAAKQVKVSRDSLLLEPFGRAAQAIQRLLGGILLDDYSVCEWSYVRSAIQSMPDRSNLVLASSMPVRYADMIAGACGREIRVFSQRGTNGIDGVISHAAGIASVSKRYTLLITGDLAFLHDLGGLSAARECRNLTILLLNNNGGGIFSFLPIAAWEDTFEALHGTPTRVNFKSACEAFGIGWREISKPSELSKFEYSGPQVVEVRTERKENFEAHQEFVARLVAGLNE